MHTAADIKDILKRTNAFQTGRLTLHKILGRFNEIAEGVVFGDGTVVTNHCYIGRDVKIGKNCKIGNFAEINNDVTIGDNVLINPHCSLNSNTCLLYTSPSPRD